MVGGAVLFLAWGAAALSAPPRQAHFGAPRCLGVRGGAHGPRTQPPSVTAPRLAGGHRAAAVASESPRAATYLEIGRFGFPLAAICVTNFAMGAIDTVCVGRFGGTLQLAALAPAVASVDSWCYVFCFLQQATLKLMGDAPNKAEKKAVLSVAMAMALAAGMVHSLISLAFAPNMVAALGASATFAPFSVQYIRIRAISACAFYLTMVGSSACFSERDSTSPFAIAVAAGFLNFLGNLFLCSRLPSALSSTAISTAAAQLAQCAATYALLARRGQLPDFRDLKRQRAAVPAPAVPAPASSWPSKVAEAVCDRTLLNRFFDVPTLQRLAPTFLAFSGGISITTSVHVFVYAFCGRSCCRIGGVTAAAAHHIASNLWWGISSLCAEPFDAALLAFLPEKLAASSQPSGPRWLDTAEARKTLRNHLVLSTLVGFALTAAVVRRVTGNSLRWLIDDAAVLAAVPVLPVALSCVLVGPMLVLEAAQVSLGCLRWLVAVMVASAIVACSGMVAVEQGRFAILPPSPDSYWLCVSLFVFLRFVGNGVGILRQCREAKPKPSRGRR